MIADHQLKEILRQDEGILQELQGKLDIPAINALQVNGRLVATTERIIFLCDVEEQLRHDSFSYTDVERIAMRRSFKNEQRVLFEADDEIQMLHSIKNIEDITSFIEIVESYLK